MSQAVKVLKETDTHYLLGGYGVVWGGKDLVGERFEADTDFWFDRITETPPVLFGHGRDNGTGKGVLGRVVSKSVDDVGLWCEMQIEKAHEYAAQVLQLVKRGVLGLSSGSVSHLVEIASDGKIVSWPMAELSLTPTPCEPRTLGVSEIKALVDAEPALKDYTDTKAVWTTAYINDLPDSAFLYIESGKDKDDDGMTIPRSARHFPVYDADGELDLPHLRNAIARIPQSNAPGLTDAKKTALQNKARKLLDAASKMLPDGPVPVMGEHGGPPDGSYEAISAGVCRTLHERGLDAWVIATFPEYVLVSAWSDDEPETYMVEYVLADDGVPVLGEMRQVEQVYVPVEMTPAEDGPMVMAAERMIRFAESLSQRTQDLAQRRAKDGRTLSPETRATIARAVDASDKALRYVRATLADPGVAGAAQAAPVADLTRARLALAKSRLSLAGLLA